MKIIFTPILLFSLLTFSISSTQAQTYDLSVVSVGAASTATNQVPAGMASPLEFTIRNNGANDIPTGTLFYVAITTNLNPFVGPDTFQFTQPFAAGSEILLTSTANYTFEPGTPVVDICGSAYFADSTLESDPSNNILCDQFSVTSAVSIDWSCDLVTIHEPTDLDGFDIDNYENTVPEIDSLTFTVTNNSQVVFNEGYELNFILSLNGDSVNLTGSFGSSVGANESRTFIVNPNSIPDVPQDSGTYDVCVSVNAALDEVDSNDVSCDDFTIIDSYDPFKPGNWPSGREEVAGNSISITPVLDQVKLEGVNNPTSVVITDMQGKTVNRLNVNTNTNVSLSNQAAGVYVIKATDSKTGHVEVRKVSKQ
ncbi:MAG: T9SS type A sorting domain-containing protein [Salibacteraceae bacterium]